MTAVGKILVFLNLLFSIVVGAFAVLDYTARTHWASEYEKLARNYQVVQSKSQAYEQEANRLARERAALNSKLYAEGKKELGLKETKDAAEAEQQAAQAATATIALLRDRNKMIDVLKTDLTRSNSQLEELNRKVKQYEATTTASQVDVQRRQLDIEKMRESLNAETKRNTALVKDMNDMRDRAVSAEITAKSVKDMNARLEGQLQDMARDMVRLRSAGGNAAGQMARGTNPPPDQVEGLVRRADGNLVTLTIGSDAGLQKGHTLEVFRLGNNARYLGRIQIVEVTPTQAVGRAVGRPTSPIQIGDTVASSVMGGRR